MSRGATVEDVKLAKNEKRWHQMDTRYFARNYGSRQNLVEPEEIEAERFQAYAAAQNFVRASDFYPDHRYGECFGGLNKEVQVNTIQTGEKPLITFEDKVGHEITDWGSNTSAHGIPQIVRASHPAVRTIWLLIYVSFVSMFIYQAVLLIKKFNRNEKIVDIELKFEAAPFPAITLCNLNPYKGSASKNAKMVSKMVFFEISHSECSCANGPEAECIADKETKPPSESEADWCMCAFDRHTDDAWPCFMSGIWELKDCTTCNDEGLCPEGAPEASHAQCYCNTMMCIAWDGAAVLRLWEYYGAPPTEDLGFLEAMGFGGMTDEVAIVTRAKENMMFAMATLSMEDRKAMSYTKEEFIHKCSFNGKQCDIEGEFITLVDPTFGNCFTYNHNRSLDLISIRAGPNYGLRLVLFVGDDEMPTTEATGIRITVHDKDQFPFPDTFGYSAQTGTISSFGLRKKMVRRLPAPYGSCLPGGNMKNFIYDGYDYSVEGCFRSCFQMAVLHACQCGDPRFPVKIPDVHCEAIDPIARKCLEARIKELGGVNAEIGCRCPQPCHQSMYDVTYSAAIWPAPKLKVAPKDCIKTPAECALEYKKHGAMIEVFYEQLNFEMLVESSAYGWVNVMSDFGGQLGLWLGLSVITCFEFFFLIFNFLHVSIHHQWLLFLERQREKERQKNG